MTRAVIEKIQEVCRDYLRADRFPPLAQREVAQALAEADNEKEANSLKGRIDSLTAHLDKVYMDKLSFRRKQPKDT